MIFFLICENKQLWSWNGAEKLYSIDIFLTLSGRVYGVGHTTAVLEKNSLGASPVCFFNCLFFRGEDTAALGITPVYRLVSLCLPAVIQEYRIQYQRKFHFIWHKITHQTIPF